MILRTKISRYDVQCLLSKTRLLNWHVDVEGVIANNFGNNFDFERRSIVIIELHWNGKESGGKFQYNCKMYLLVAVYVYVYDKMAFDLACRFKILTKLP